MSPSTSRKALLKKKPTPTSISLSQKKAALRSKPICRSASIASTQSSQRSIVEDIEDEEPTHVGDTLDINGDVIMEEVEDGEKTPIEVSDEEVEDDEAELSVYFAFMVRSMTYHREL
jgi:hypothetical protein